MSHDMMNIVHLVFIHNTHIMPYRILLISCKVHLLWMNSHFEQVSLEWLKTISLTESLYLPMFVPFKLSKTLKKKKVWMEQTQASGVIQSVKCPLLERCLVNQIREWTNCCIMCLKNVRCNSEKCETSSRCLDENIYFEETQLWLYFCEHTSSVGYQISFCYFVYFNM